VPASWSSTRLPTTRRLRRRRALALAESCWTMARCGRVGHMPRSLFTYDRRIARRKTARAWVPNHVLLGLIAALRCATRLLRKTR